MIRYESNKYSEPRKMNQILWMSQLSICYIDVNMFLYLHMTFTFEESIFVRIELFELYIALDGHFACSIIS